MAKDSDDRRFVWGPRPLGTLIPHLTRPVFRKKSPAGALLMADWAEIVGPGLAAVTSPKRVTSGTLTIGCVGPVAMELSHLAPQLIERINAQLGKPVVERLRFVQQAATATPARPRPAPEAKLPPRVEAAVGNLPAGELREALAKLARGVYRNRG
ncbi:DUF721 domain-containing protein [Belnapia rosea]|uniref:DUF721 domain-containing protein n=1 Tax=Belnapia rosea TaxID=938405 RepID=A0A1G6V1F0_9PROT|nr:DciA family protein [Belnapia rosea]SDB72335.1 hypothetical protein SAMN02927895_04381 [Belnapia rosea]SDD47368.1 hypothetical protein SAMN04487779_100893 [Belnapia rosea]